MARLSVPHYSPTARGTYICETDSALDKDRFERECQELEAKGRDRKEHPLIRYWIGENRYQPDGVMDHGGQQVRPRDYFNADLAEEFALRRLTWVEYNNLEQMPDWRTRCLRACRFGVVGVENSPIKLERDGNELTSDSMQALHDVHPELPVTLGTAVMLYNRPPTAAEKKA